MKSEERFKPDEGESAQRKSVFVRMTDVSIVSHNSESGKRFSADPSLCSEIGITSSERVRFLLSTAATRRAAIKKSESDLGSLETDL
jgi:hypothetical protein